jgi:hypothetical protein
VRFKAVVVNDDRTLEHAPTPWSLMRFEDAENLVKQLTEMAQSVRALKLRAIPPGQ